MKLSGLSILPSSLLLLCGTSLALNLNITAIGTKDGRSTLECWQIAAPFSMSSQAGTSGSAITQLGGVTNLTYTVIPSNFDGGVHNAPYSQWVAFTSGLAEVTIPGDNSTVATIQGGEFGLIYAADTAALSKTGHRTVYPGITETIALQIPAAGNVPPKHTVLHWGPCTAKDVAGLRGLATSGS